MLDTVYVRLATQSRPDEDVKRAIRELRWAIEELAYDADHLNKCTEEVAEAMRAVERAVERAAENLQMVTESSSHIEPHAHENDKAHTESAVDGINRT